MLTLKFDDSEIRKAIKDKWDIRSATRSALKNVIAFSGLDKELSGAMNATIDRPTPFTNQKGFEFYLREPGKGANDPLVAQIGVKRKQAAYLQFMIKGIARDQKIIERKGPDGALLTPTKRIKLNAYGNVPKNEYAKILRLAQAKADGYFWQPVRRGRLPAGIYRRTDDGIMRLFTVANPSAPKTTFDFYGVATRLIDKRLKPAIEEAIRYRLSQK
jgi:hypothetical protein